jgi:hypothetical protein
VILEPWVHYHLGRGDHPDVLLADRSGRYLRESAVAARYRTGPGYDGDALADQVLGCRGEVVVARLLGVTWAAVHGQRHGDVGSLEVRTNRAHDWPLRVMPKDPDDALVVQVTTEDRPDYRVFRVQGFVLASHAKAHPEWRYVIGRGRPPYWWVPRTDLWPMRSMGLVIAMGVTL